MTQPNEPTGPDLPEFECDPTATLEARLAQRPSLKRRALQMGTVALVVLMGMFVLLRATTLPPFGAMSSAAGTLIIQTNISAGTLRVNRHAYTFTAFSLAVPVQRGSNQIELDAPPFNRHICTVIWPTIDYAGSSGICPSTSAQSNGTATIDLMLDSSDLPTTLQQGAIAAINVFLADALSATTLAQPGELYGLGASTEQDIPPTATFTTQTHVQLTAEVDQRPADTVCQQTILCSVDMGKITFASTDAFTWEVTAAALAAWRFTDATGKVTIVPANGSFEATPFAPFDQQFTLTYAHNQCQVAVLTHETSAQQNAALAYEMHFAVCNALIFGEVSLVNSQYHFANVSLEGCSIAYIDIGPITAPPLVIVRFGALLAANAAAHKLIPALPLASAAAIAAVQRGGQS